MRITVATGPAFPVPTLLGGACPRRWQGVAEEWARRGHEVCIFARSFPGQPDEEVIDDVRYLRWGGFSQSLSIWKDLARDFGYAISAVKRLPSADILVTNDFWLPVFASWTRKRSGCVVVNAGRFPKGQYRLYKRVARVAAASVAIRNAIVRECPSLESRTRVFHNPVDLRTMSPGTPSSQNGTHTLLYVGRLHPEKGVHLLIDAFARLYPKFSNWRVQLVGPLSVEQGGGGSDYERQLAARIRDLPVEIHAPEFDLAKLFLHYKSATLFCYPSLAEKGEAFGVAPLESMACAVPPVVSGLECFQDFISHEYNGWVFDHRVADPVGSLAAALDTAMGDSSRRSQLATRARETAERFSYASIAERYLADFATLKDEAQSIDR